MKKNSNSFHLPLILTSYLLCFLVESIPPMFIWIICTMSSNPQGNQLPLWSHPCNFLATLLLLGFGDTLESNSLLKMEMNIGLPAPKLLHSSNRIRLLVQLLLFALEKVFLPRLKLSFVNLGEEGYAINKLNMADTKPFSPNHNTSNGPILIHPNHQTT